MELGVSAAREVYLYTVANNNAKITLTKQQKPSVSFAESENLESEPGPTGTGNDRAVDSLCSGSQKITSCVSDRGAGICPEIAGDMPLCMPFR